MQDASHLLVVVDPNEKRQPALERAVWFAKQCGASLELFACVYEQGLASPGLYAADALECARKDLVAASRWRLKEHARRLAADGIEVRVDARWGHPLDAAIVEKVEESLPDFVLKETHYHSPLRRSLFSSTDWNLIRTCPVPLWLVKPRPITKRPCIVAAVDPLHAHDKPASLDDAIIASAKALEAAVGGDLYVFHAYDIAPALALSPDSMMMPISLPVRDVSAALERRHSAAVHALAERHSIDPCKVQIHEGPTRQLLVALTEQMDADIAVLGAVSRTGLGRVFVGSTAEQVLDKLPCDLVIIKPPRPAAGAD